MPSPKHLADVRASVRDVITYMIMNGQDDTEQELLDRTGEPGRIGGEHAVTAVADILLNGMIDLRDLTPNGKLAGIAGYLQRKADTWGEPGASAGRGIIEVVRQIADAKHTDTPAVRQARDEVWARHGVDGPGYGLSVIVAVYIHVARAMNTTTAEAWATAAERDRVKIQEWLDSDDVRDEQALWDAGFTEDEMTVLLDRLRTMVMEVHETGEGSAEMADLATTDEKKQALLGFYAGIRRRRDGKRRAEEARRQSQERAAAARRKAEADRRRERKRR